MSDIIHVNGAASTSSDLCYVTNMILMAAPAHMYKVGGAEALRCEWRPNFEVEEG